MTIATGIYHNLTAVNWTSDTRTERWMNGDLDWIARWLDANDVDCGVIMRDITYLNCRISQVMGIRGGGEGLLINNLDYPESPPTLFDTFKVVSLLIPSDAYHKMTKAWYDAKMALYPKLTEYVRETYGEEWYGGWKIHGGMYGGLYASFKPANNPPAGFDHQPSSFGVDVWADGSFKNARRYDRKYRRV